MRTRRLHLVIAAAAFLAGSPAALGCGDKFVVLGRGVRFGRAYAAKFPGSVLIYVNPTSHMPVAMKEFRLETMIRAAGHKTRTVESAADFEQALASGKYDIVLADIGDGAEAQRRAGSVSVKPTVIPVLYKPTPAELEGVEQKYGCLIAPASSRRSDLLPVLDKAMQNRKSGAGVRCQTAT